MQHDRTTAFTMSRQPHGDGQLLGAANKPATPEPASGSGGGMGQDDSLRQVDIYTDTRSEYEHPVLTNGKYMYLPEESLRTIYDFNRSHRR